MRTLFVILLTAVLLPGFALAEGDLFLDFDQGVFDSWTVQGRTTTPTWQSTTDSDTEMPVAYELGLAYPNPFNPSTKFSISLPDAADLKVSIYNVIGQQVEVLVDQRMVAGRHSLTFDARNMASGVYFIQAIVPGELNEMQKVVLMK
jgi:Secretion system C-terminal sorting domain